jgi:hypothetical protein
MPWPGQGICDLEGKPLPNTHFELTLMQAVFSVAPFVLLRNFPAGQALQDPTSGEAAAEYFPEGHCNTTAKFELFLYCVN